MSEESQYIMHNIDLVPLWESATYPGQSVGVSQGTEGDMSPSSLQRNFSNSSKSKVKMLGLG